MNLVRYIFESCVSAKTEDRIREWAYDNAYTLVLVTVLCIGLMAFVVGAGVIGGG